MTTCYKKDFPILIQHPDLLYLDNAATTLKPRSVIHAVTDFYQTYTANVFRGSHKNSERATHAFESTREKTADFIGAKKNEIIFTHNCTDSINLVAQCLNLTKTDAVILSPLSHHSAYLPFAEQATIRQVKLNAHGTIDLAHLKQLISQPTKLIVIPYVSNVTGAIQAVDEIIQLAQEKSILTLIDGAQAVGHFPIHVHKLNCDFMAFSSHKMLGPSGVGILYGRYDLLSTLNPYRYGGGMVNKIQDLTIDYDVPPYRFEAGTPNIEGVIAFGSAIDYFNQIGFTSLEAHLNDLAQYADTQLRALDCIEFPFPHPEQFVPIFSFLPRNRQVSVNEIARILSDSYHIAVNAGQHCCQPLYHYYQIDTAIRASFYLYQSREAVDVFIDALQDLSAILK